MIFSDKLPTEIVEPIIRLLPRKALYQCLFVSRKFHLLSEKLYYSNFESPYNHGVFYHQFKTTRFSGQTLSSLIQKLCIRSDGNEHKDRLSPRRFEETIQQMIQLEQLEFDVSYGSLWYIQILLLCPHYLRQIKELFIRSHMKGRGELSQPEEEKVREYLFESKYSDLEKRLCDEISRLNRHLCSQIKRMSLSPFIRKPFGDSQILDDVFLLSLDHIYEMNNTPYVNLDFNLDQIFLDFRNLEEVNIRTLNLKPRIRPVAPKPEGLKAVRIELDDLLMSDMMLMARHLPVGLKYLTVNASRWLYVEETDDTLESGTVKDFLSHISRHEHVRFSYSINHELPEDDPSDLPNSSDMNMAVDRRRQRVLAIVLEYINHDSYPVHLTVGFSPVCLPSVEHYSIWMNNAKNEVHVCMIFNKENSSWIERVNLDFYHSVSLRYDYDVDSEVMFQDINLITNNMKDNQKQYKKIGHPKFDGKKCQHINPNECFRTNSNIARI